MNKNSRTVVTKEQNHSEQGTKPGQALERRVREMTGRLRARSGWRAGRDEGGFFVGLDLGDKKSHYCVLDTKGEIVTDGAIATTWKEITAYFVAIPRVRIALEVGTHSGWVNALLKSFGHTVYVANPRKMESIRKNRRKNDKVDAQTLARLLRADPELLYPIRHRGEEARTDLVLLRVRDALVRARTRMINCVRGLVKSAGDRVPPCSAESFHRAAVASMPKKLAPILQPLVDQIESLTVRITEFDKVVEAVAERKYPETEVLRQVRGVGPVTSLAFVLTIEDPGRFHKSRDVGPYLGLVPRQDESGERSPQLRITKEGDTMMRRLLVGSSQYIMGPFGEDSDLRRHGERIAARGGKNAKKRAVVAVARKLGVLLHRLWVTGEVYEPLYNSARMDETLEPEVRA